MQDGVFNELADLALKGSGQAIPRSKSYLIEARLAPIARREGFGSLEDLVHCLKSRANPVFAAECAAALVQDIDRQTTAGGVWTPAAAMGGKLVERLEARAGLTFQLEDE